MTMSDDDDDVDDDGNHSPTNHNNHEDATRMTCDVLCSLGAVGGGPAFVMDSSTGSACASMTYAADVSFADCTEMGVMDCMKGGKSASLSGCPKQHQLPMFLSSEWSICASFVFVVQDSYCR